MILPSKSLQADCFKINDFSTAKYIDSKYPYFMSIISVGNSQISTIKDSINNSSQITITYTVKEIFGSYTSVFNNPKLIASAQGRLGDSLEPLSPQLKESINTAASSIVNTTAKFLSLNTIQGIDFTTMLLPKINTGSSKPFQDIFIEIYFYAKDISQTLITKEIFKYFINNFSAQQIGKSISVAGGIYVSSCLAKQTHKLQILKSEKYLPKKLSIDLIDYDYFSIKNNIIVPFPYKGIRINLQLSPVIPQTLQDKIGLI